MGKLPIDRRRVLGLGAALATGTALGTAAGSARAFQIEEASPQTRQLYSLACEAPARHVQLLAEIDAQLAGRHLSGADIAAIKARAACPFCGCALVQAEPSGDKPASEPSL